MPFAQNFALVTGTSTGIGLATARLLVERDWDVIGIARRASPLSSPRYQHISLDLADLPAVTRELESRVAPMVRDPARRRIALVNNAALAALLAPIQSLDADPLATVFEVNVVAPLWCMGFMSRHTPLDAALRIVNVSSGAAVHAFPGMAAYCSSKAALRMAGMVMAEEWKSTVPHAPTRANAALLSFEPGVVDTPMQEFARSHSPEHYPWVGMFKAMQANGLLVSADRPASEIVAFLESDSEPPFAERRFGV